MDHNAEAVSLPQPQEENARAGALERPDIAPGNCQATLSEIMREEFDLPVPPPPEIPEAQRDTAALGMDRVTRQLFTKLAASPGLNLIMGSPGSGKTLFLNNLAVIAALSGTKVTFVTLEMSARQLRPRFHRILHVESAAGDVAAAARERVCSRIVLRDHANAAIRPDELCGQVAAAAAGSLFIFDASEVVATAGFDEREGLLQDVERAATAAGVGCWTSSQLKREAEGVELPSNELVYLSPAKIQTATLVVSIAGTETQGLKTLGITKDRHGVFDDRTVYRMTLSADQRLVVLPGRPCPARCRYGPVPAINAHAADFPPGCAPQLGTATPGGEGDGDDAGDDDGDGVQDEDPTAREVRPAGHANGGFVALDRRLFFDSVWFKNREFERVYRLADLAQLAEFKVRKFLHRRTRREIALQRGDFFVSMRTLAKRWSVSPDTASRFLAEAQAEGVLTVDTQRDGTLIHLNYYSGKSQTDDANTKH